MDAHVPDVELQDLSPADTEADGEGVLTVGEGAGAPKGVGTLSLDVGEGAVGASTLGVGEGVGVPEGVGTLPLDSDVDEAAALSSVHGVNAVVGFVM
jgi:hypothetical protein